MKREGGRDARGSSSSSSRDLAAAGADTLRCRVDELVVVLRSVLGEIATMDAPRSNVLCEKLSGALDAAADVHDGLGKLALVALGRAAPACPVDVHEPLETALRMTRAIVGRRARLIRRYERVPAVHADKTALTRVFAQLLQNAADAVPPYMPLANCISVRTYAEADGGVVVEIADTGIGLTAATLESAFEPFFTTKSGAADGLGLTIARGDVVAGGGTITAESVEGQGSRFRVRLPGVPGTSGEMERIFTSELPLRRVMVVADDAARGERLRLMFCDARTIAVLAHSDEAVERLGMGEACDLVVVANDDPACADLRERLAEVAPDVVMRTFEVRLDRGADAVDSSSSGLWKIAAR
jgi:hypothetical protein